jgi:hypothetical protein
MGEVVDGNMDAIGQMMTGTHQDQIHVEETNHG